MKYLMNRKSVSNHGSPLEFVLGSSPILLICPHGHPDDDTNTDIITKKLAASLDAFAVINMGFSRTDTTPDVKNLKANLNNADHVDDHVPVFGEKIKEFQREILSFFNTCNVFIIHGMADRDDNVDVVLGYGKAKTPSYTCSENYKNELAYQLTKAKLVVKQGGVGSKYSAASSTNMNQYFKKHGLSVSTNSIQIELTNALRNPVAEAEKTAKKLSRVIHEFVYKDIVLPNDFKVGNV
jgi:hypothetical protein